MSDLLDIQGKLQDTAGALARLKVEFARQPDSRSLLLNIKSLEKRQRKLEAEFRAAAGTGYEVCSYRLMPEKERLKLAGLTSVLSGYQSLVSLFYSALKTGPKATTKLGVEAAEGTAFDFAYAFAGSAGFVFTVPNEGRLFSDPYLEDSVRLVFEIAKARKPEEILEHAHRLGPAPIRALFRWADAHVRWFISAEIEWRRGDEVRQRALIQMPEFRQLQQAISATSDDETQELNLTGEMVGADVSNRTFHFRTDDGADVRGNSGGVIDQTHSVELPKRYAAKVRKTTKVLFSTDEEKVAYDLLQLDPI